MSKYDKELDTSGLNCPLPINFKSKSSFLFRGIEPSKLIGIIESFNSIEKSTSKVELVYLICPLSNTSLLFFSKGSVIEQLIGVSSKEDIAGIIEKLINE